MTELGDNLPQVLVSGAATHRPLPVGCISETHRFGIGGHEFQIVVSLYEDGQPGEILISVSKEGTTVRGLVEAFAIAVSTGLQYGVPLAVYVEKFSGVRFDPAGYTGNPDIPIAKSLVDYIFRWLELKFLSADKKASEVESRQQAAAVSETQMPAPTSTANNKCPPCHVCDAITVRSGVCYACPNCGTTTGCD